MTVAYREVIEVRGCGRLLGAMLLLAAFCAVLSAGASWLGSLLLRIGG